MYKLNGESFVEANEKWAEFVYNNRIDVLDFRGNYHNQAANYDWVYGPVADSRIASLKFQVKNNQITPQQFQKLLKAFDQYNQVSFHSIASLEAITFDKEVIIDGYTFKI